jgi:DNA-binding SARP family transcriptional activator
MIELRVLGGLSIGAPGLSTNARAHRRHSLGLLALVATAAPPPIAREKVMALLWPESNGDRASNSLRQMLFWLRREFGEDLLLPETTSGLQLDPARIRVDLWGFREALARGAHADAVAHYTGPFLDGFQIPGAAEFSHRVEAERDRLARDFADALDALARRAQDEGRFDEAVGWRRRQAAADPFSARVAVALLRSLNDAGDRAGALEYAAIYENLVRLHLEIEPDPSVLEFVSELRAAPAVPRPARRVARSPEPSEATSPREVMPRPARRSRRTVWLPAALAIIVAAGGFTVLGRRAAAGGPTTIVLASGALHHAGRDVMVRLVECSGPACPPESLPAAAYVIPAHGFYTPPAAGTNYIAPVPDGTTAESPGYSCCTTAVFEHAFQLPPEATSARIVISVRADNQASLAINGVEFARQQEELEAGNYSGAATTFAADFVPEPDGRNHLRVTLWDGGGALGLYYHAVITHETRADPPASSP